MSTCILTVSQEIVGATKLFLPAMCRERVQRSRSYLSPQASERSPPRRSFQFSFAAEGGLAASPWDPMYIPSDLPTPGGGYAMSSTFQATGEDVLGGNLPLFSNGDSQEWPVASSVSLGDGGHLQDTQIVSSSTGLPHVPPSDLTAPSSSVARHLPTAVATASRSSVAQRSHTQAPNAVAGPSRSVPVVPRETTFEVEASTVTQLRRSGRKRHTTTTSYAEDAVHAPPPAKKRKVSGGKTAQPSPAPSTASTSGSASGQKAVKHNRDSRRPREEVDALLVPDSPDVACPAEDCTEMLNASRRASKQFGAPEHALLKCLRCPEQNKLVPGNMMVDHVAQENLRARYRSPYCYKEGVLCTKTFKKTGYTNKHMLKVHKAPNWSSEFVFTLAKPSQYSML
ncbi:uncharacterized protein TRAVEDRAFT_22370 [Trametes versicolor FP-101664 SS1]|uniref:uncharacterized protein n=1 Tax=Trametes versicolor (strain FP-101664) TaxID=717944 RepID=UPI000462198B|nr:uncharacterized protein TRAVEDRAFT_22370 [Trametes versicolor FP-101664 SS1]EIW55975.1 hypothetical protein TRAVEDRAFT_22370 [Trametes versicolor FP-101664 SS1]